MSSIHRNQPEDVRKDLRGAEAIARIREVVEKASNCFFCTRVSTGGSNGVRPMAVQQVDDQGHLWFMSATDSHKNAEVLKDDRVALLFQADQHSGFLHLSGRVHVLRDKAKLDEIWTPIAKTWFTEGKDDPCITLLRFVPDGGYYWDNKHGDTIAGIKMMIGAAIGKTLDDSIEGKIAP